jgi:hypothetical protein
MAKGLRRRGASVRILIPREPYSMEPWKDGIKEGWDKNRERTSNL